MEYNPIAIFTFEQKADSRSTNAWWRLCNDTIYLHGSGDRLLEVICRAWLKDTVHQDNLLDAVKSLDYQSVLSCNFDDGGFHKASAFNSV